MLPLPGLVFADHTDYLLLLLAPAPTLLLLIASIGIDRHWLVLDVHIEVHHLHILRGRVLRRLRLCHCPEDKCDRPPEDQCDRLPAGSRS